MFAASAHVIFATFFSNKVTCLLFFFFSFLFDSHLLLFWSLVKKNEQTDGQDNNNHKNKIRKEKRKRSEESYADRRPEVLPSSLTTLHSHLNYTRFSPLFLSVCFFFVLFCSLQSIYSPLKHSPGRPGALLLSSFQLPLRRILLLLL